MEFSCTNSSSSLNEQEDEAKSAFVNVKTEPVETGHYKDEIFECLLCNEQFGRESKLEFHLESCEGKNGLKEELKSGKRFRCHSQPEEVHAGERPSHYECPLCHEQFGSKSELESHLERCGAAKVKQEPEQAEQKAQSKDYCYACEICNRRFQWKSRFERHKKNCKEKSKEKLKFVCQECGSRFHLESRLTIHMRGHTGERPFHCEECDKQFKSRRGLKLHRIVHNERTLACKFCSRKFKRKTHLRAHLSVHSDICEDLNFACEYCERRFDCKNKLEIHLRGHTGERPFKCSHCEMCFMSKASLINHLVLHDESNVYACQECNTVYRCLRYLKQHRRRVHMKDHAVKNPVVKKNYACTLCDRVYRSNVRLVKHLQSRHGETSAETILGPD